MEKIIIGFSKSKKKLPVFSWLIRAVLGTHFSHVYIKFFSNHHKRWLIYQASGTQVNFMAEEHFNNLNEVTDEFELEITPESKFDMMCFCIDNAGAPYGLKEIFGIFLNQVCEKAYQYLKCIFKDGQQSYVCSELVSYILRDYANVSIEKDYDLVTPKDVYTILKDINNL